jgi:hypothetical protein
MLHQWPKLKKWGVPEMVRPNIHTYIPPNRAFLFAYKPNSNPHLAFVIASTVIPLLFQYSINHFSKQPFVFQLFENVCGRD